MGKRFKKTFGLKSMKRLSQKTITIIICIVCAAIFLISSIPLASYVGEKSKKPAYIIVDMGNGQVYKGTIPLTENKTALYALSGFAYSVEIENGTVKCIANFCNTNSSAWKFYTTETSALGPVEKEVNKNIETYQLSEGETFVFRYTLL